MATTITFSLTNDDETKPIFDSQLEDQYLLSPPKTVFKPLPPVIKQTIETDRRQHRIPISKSTSDFLTVKQISIDIPDDDYSVHNQTTINKIRSHENRNHSILSSRRTRSPSELRVTLYSDENINVHENLTHSQLEISDSKYKNGLGRSDLSLVDRRNLKQNRIDIIRRALLERRFARRIHSTYSSSTTLRSLSRRRSTQNLYFRSRRNLYHLPRNSKWHIVRHRLHDIAMMSESYARMKLLEQDLRWANLREKIRIQVLDMREMSLLRQQDDGLILKKKSHKTRFDLKDIPIDEVVHIERDGRVYSISTRDLVLGRLLCDEAIQLDTFAQLDARRQFQIQQHLRLRDLFRGPSSAERKPTISSSISSLVPLVDVNAFVNAAQDKDTDTLHKYLLAGFSPDQPDPSTKATALHVAVESANIRAIQMLLQAGAQVNVTDASFSTPLHIAAYMGNEEIVQILLSHGADMYKQDNTGRNSFHLAVSTGNNRLIQNFILTTDTGQNIIHTPDGQNWTPLMCACASNHPATCALLLSHNADLCAVNDRGMTAFHVAAFLGSLPVLQELLTSSSNDEIIVKAINQGDNRNQTPLFYACIEGHLEIALTLLRAGANAYHLDNDDQTCLHAMLSSSIILKRHIRLFYYFIQFVDYRLNQDFLGRTLLDLAYSNQLNTIIHLLILLNYKTNSNINYNNKQILSLRHICILYFKRSIIYHRYQQQATQHDLLEHALHQTFQIVLHKDLTNIKENKPIEYSIGKSLDDITLLQQQQQQSNKHQKHGKTTKNLDKKMRKTSSIFSTTSTTNKWSSQTDLQHTHSTWSAFTNKIKGQRLSHIITNPQHMPIDEETNSLHLSSINPMKNLAFEILTTPSKLDNLLDFPSLKNDYLLNEDLKMSMSKYNLLGTDLVNQT
ncbi:unnamed protein product [Rotaria sp. Silwood1]|nr:unnamed protein product [Rotaria sp. Silwood1]